MREIKKRNKKFRKKEKLGNQSAKIIFFKRNRKHTIKWARNEKEIRRTRKYKEAQRRSRIPNRLAKF